MGGGLFVGVCGGAIGGGVGGVGGFLREAVVGVLGGRAKLGSCSVVGFDGVFSVFSVFSCFSFLFLGKFLYDLT